MLALTVLMILTVDCILFTKFRG